MTHLRWIRFESAALGGHEVNDLEGEDELNRLFSLTVRLVIPGLAVTERLVRDLLEQPAKLSFEEGGGEVAWIHGVVAELWYAEAAEDDAASLSLTLVPRAWRMTQTRRSELFLDRSVPEVLAELLRGAGLEEDRDFVLALRGGYPARELVAQHAESDFDLFARLCEDVGIIFFFRHAADREVLVLADTPDAFEPIDRPRPELRAGARGEDRGAFDVARSRRRAPEQAVVHDYNHRAPHLDLLAASACAADPPPAREGALGRQIEYGIHVKTLEEAARLATVRAQELGAMREVISGRSTEMTLRPGATFVLVDGAGDAQRLLVTKVVHRAHLAGEDDGRGERTWHNEFLAIPADVPYRPPRRTPKPRIAGLCHAVVDGIAQGPYAELDEAGCYRVRFRRDLSVRGELLASRPVRMLQPHAGARYGMHFPLRPGTEVLIAFVEGDPDRPVIVGAVPNAVTPSPVERPNQTQNVLRTASFNELVMEDLAGRRRIRLHTPHERTTLQLGALEEPEEGALVSTDASVTAAAGRSINEVTDRSVVLCGSSSALVGDSAVLLAGVEGLCAAVREGMQRIGAVLGRRDVIAESLERMAEAPGEAPAGEAVEAGAAEGGTAGGRWSDLAADLAARARQAVIGAISRMTRTVNAHLRRSLGRLDGQPLGEPAAGSAIVGSPATAALFGRDSALVFGDRAASLASEDTASIVGGETAQIVSPASVEVAAGEQAKLTSARTIGVEAHAVRIVGGYFPRQDAKPLGEGTSVGVLARDELQLASGQDCVLICAHKNVLVTAHTGSMKLKAEEAATISAGSVAVRGGEVHARADGDLALEADGDARVGAGGTLRIEAAAVEIVAGRIALQGLVEVAGDLLVHGTVNGKRL